MPVPNRETDLQHRITELEEQLAAAKASTAARAGLRDYIQKHPALTATDVAMIAAEMRAPGRFRKPGRIGRVAGEAMTPLGKALRAAREAKGWSTDAVADKVGCHQASISAWERGKNMPGEQQHAALKRVLGVDVVALLQKRASANGAAPSS